MKKSVTYPDWAEKYRAKGRTLRKVRDGYGLYECTSTYSKGQKYPKSVQTYLGMITEKDGFIPKKTILIPSYSIEYGLSHFIMANFKRDLERAVYGSSKDIVTLGIIYYLFGEVNETFIRSTYLTNGIEGNLIERMNKGLSVKRLKTVGNKIESLFKQSIPDDSDRIILQKLLFLSVINKNSKPESVIYPDEVKTIVERYGLKL